MCNKVPYNTKEEAKKDSKRIRAESVRFNRTLCRSKTGRKMTPYLCDFCRKWHLSTMSKQLFKKVDGTRRRRNKAG
jgi:hypothetical protein